MQGKLKYTYLLIATTYLLLAVGMSFSYGQKKKNKSSARENRHVALSAEKQAQAEQFFTEGVKNAIIEDYPKAINYLRRTLELDADNHAAYYKLAEVLSKTGELRQAEKSMEAALALQDSNKYYYILAADIQSQQGQFTKAATLYESMLANTNAGPQHILELAVLYLHMHEYEKAIRAFNEAEEILGVNEQIVLQKQKLYLQQGNLKEALREGEKLVSNFPAEPAYVVQQAEILLNNQRYDEAKRYLKEYLSEQPGQPQAEFLLAKLYQQQNDFGAASVHLQNAFQDPALDLDLKVQEVATLLQQLPQPALAGSLDSLTRDIVEAHPQEAKAHIVRGDFLFATQDKQAARSSYLRALEIDKNNFNVWQNTLSLGLELGRFDSVARESEQALELFPNQAAIYYFSGAANLNKKKYQEAVWALEQGKKLAASNLELVSIFHTHLGDAYNGMKNYDKSDAAYEAALQLNPDNDYILNNYSYYLSLRQEKLDLALELTERLIKKHPDNPTYLDTHAWVLYQLKQYKEARRHLEHAIANEGDQDGTILEHYGDVLYKLNKKEEAVSQWQKARLLPNTSDLLDKKINDRTLYE
jgi:tetratricopeptide (TPR) repeat protein